MSGPNKNLNTALDRIKAYFENCPEISAVYLFGSQIKGNARKGSDLDIAVLFAEGFSPLDRFEKKLGILNDLEDLLEIELDLVDLESVDLFFLHQVMKAKILLVEQDKNRRVEFEVNKRKEYFDRKHFFELYHQQALKRLDQQRSN